MLYTHEKLSVEPQSTCVTQLISYSKADVERELMHCMNGNSWSGLSRVTSYS